MGHEPYENERSFSYGRPQCLRQVCLGIGGKNGRATPAVYAEVQAAMAVTSSGAAVGLGCFSRRIGSRGGCEVWRPRAIGVLVWGGIWLVWVFGCAAGGGLRLVRARLAGVVWFGRAKAPGAGGSRGLFVVLVAGTGFEPVTFRL